MAFKLNLNVTPNNSYDSPDIQQFYKKEVPIEQLLIWCSTNDASDLYIKEWSQPYISRFGKIVKIPCLPTTRNVWMDFYDLYVKEELNAKYVREKMLDTSTEIRIPDDNPYYGKFDKNFFRYRTSLGFSENNRIATFRMIRPEDPTFDTINYPEECKDALKKAYNEKTGIIFFTGPTGSGKQLFKDTLIPTTTGNKKIENLVIGDIIFDKNGKQTKIIDKYSPYETKFYELTFSDNTKIKAGAGHLWEVDLLNKWSHHGDTRYYNRYLTDTKFIDALSSITDSNMKLNDFINYIVNNSNFTTKNFRNFLYKYFKDFLIRKDDNYIDLNLILANSTHINAQNRVDKIKRFIEDNQRHLINNTEAKKLLGSKFIQIIRKAGIEYNSNKEIIIDAKLFSKILLNWIDEFKEFLTIKNETKVLTTQELVDIGVRNHANRLNFAIKRPDACKYNKIELPIKPYFLGAWLGDGLSAKSAICGIDDEIFDRCHQDYSIKKTIYHTENRVIPLRESSFDIRTILKTENLINNKHVPDIYKIAAPEDKLELLAGLIDTDGHIDSKGQIEICLTNEQIINSIREIACSLGIKCSPIKKRKGKYTKDGEIHECKMTYRLFLTPLINIPLQVKRKREILEKHLTKNKNQQIRHERFYITDIKEIEGNSKDYYCLAVDSPTHVFLCTESYIPTHNTTTLAAVMNSFTQPGEILDNKVFITLEDPIEYTFHSTDSVKFSQKELDKDFISFASGIKQALREHPNCVNVGEARDREVIQAAIEAARTGHLVSTSFHAGDVGGTVSRLLFHLDNNKDLSYDLILNLNIIMSQKLLKQDDRYLVDTQYLLFTDEIREHLLDIVNNEKNVQFEINKLIKNERLQQEKIVKDWSYEN